MPQQSKPCIVVAFDPGFTTGFAVGSITGLRQFNLLEVGEFDWERRFTEVFRLVGLMPEHIVVEDFLLFEHKKSDQVGSRFPSARVIGLVDTAAWVSGILNRVHMQMPNVRSNVSVLPEHAKQVGANPHAHDAYQHLRYYIIMLTERNRRNA